MDSATDNLQRRLIPGDEEKYDEISYSIIRVHGRNRSDVLSDLAVAINVQTTLDGKTELPYVGFNGFETCLQANKLFLYGTTGCGKSRAILEISRRKIDEVDQICVLNPRNIVGIESGRTSLGRLVDPLAKNVLIIWDNFPDDMLKRDIDNAKRALDIIASKNVDQIIALKPRYLEAFRDLARTSPELYAHEISYDKEKFSHIVKTYGQSLAPFRSLYQKILFSIDKISRILWQKEPTPMIILDYYRQLAQEHPNENAIDVQVDAISEAETLLRSSSFYEHQFKILTDFYSRKAEVEFLYTLTTCYEIGQARTLDNIEALQSGIFHSTPPPDIGRSLSGWIYVSGQYLSMHDVCKTTVRPSDYVKARITKYICDNFSSLVTNESSQIHSLGLFLGRNFEFIPRDSSHRFLPEHIHQYMKGNVDFENALGQGIGEIFETVDEDLQEVILGQVDSEIEYAKSMATVLGNRSASLDSYEMRKVLIKIYHSIMFARFFGISLGQFYRLLDRQKMAEIYTYMATNNQFADGFGVGIGYTFSSLSKELQNEVFEIAKTNSEMNRGLGCGFALTFQSLSKELQNEVFEIAKTNSEFDKGLAMGFALNFKTLRQDFKNQILTWASKHSEFMFGLGLYSVFASLNQIPDEVLSRVEIDGELAWGLGYGIGIYFVYLSKQAQDELLKQASQNIRFELGLGFGLGMIFNQLPNEIKTVYFAYGNTRRSFDEGLGFGFGYTWIYLPSSSQEEAFERANTNSEFAYGLGYGLGYIFRYITKENRQRLLEFAKQNSKFDSGLGSGLGYSFLYLDETLQHEAFERANTNSEFAYGLGYGLGRIFNYLPEERRDKIVSKGKSNRRFNRGLGFGLGSVAIRYLKPEFLDELIAKSNPDDEFLMGLGAGTGYASKYYHSTIQERKIMEYVIPRNMWLLCGLGLGFGMSFGYLPPEGEGQSSPLLTNSYNNPQFVLGIGEGLGQNYNYLQEAQRKELEKKADKNAHLGRGLGIGLGSIIYYLSDESKNELFNHIQKNSQFAIGVGQAIGRDFNYIDTQFQDRIFNEAQSNIHFGIGLGYGLGIHFGYLDNEIQKHLLEYSLSPGSEYLAKGMSLGLNENDAYLGSQNCELISEFLKHCKTKLDEAGIAVNNYDLRIAASDPLRDTMPRLLFDLSHLPVKKKENRNTVSSTSKSINTTQKASSISEDSNKDPKKVGITFSIDELTLETIRRDSKRDRISLNVKVNNILSRYYVCDKYIERDRSLAVPSVIAAKMIEDLPEKLLIEEYRHVIFEWIPSILIENVQIQLTLENWIKYGCSKIMAFAGLIQSFSYRIEDGGLLYLVFNHDYGLKWSRMLDSLLSEFIDRVLDHRSASTVTSNSLVLKIQKDRNDKDASKYHERLKGENGLYDT